MAYPRGYNPIEEALSNLEGQGAVEVKALLHRGGTEALVEATSAALDAVTARDVQASLSIAGTARWFDRRNGRRAIFCRRHFRPHRFRCVPHG
jgi:hypothetical protein